jgi:hypothetical protein
VASFGSGVPEIKYKPMQVTNATKTELRTKGKTDSNK